MLKQLLGTLCLLPCLAQAQTPYPFTVKGKIGELNAPAKIYLMQGQQVLDSASFRQGTFELKGSTNVPKAVSLVLKRDGKLGSGIYGANDLTRVYLEPVPVMITSRDSLKNATITGGPITADDQRLAAAMKQVAERQRVMLNAELAKVPAEQRSGPAFQERMQALFDAGSKEYAQAYRAFIKANPKSWVSLDGLYTLKMLEKPDYAVVAPLYQALSLELKNSPQGKSYGELVQALKAVAIGASAPTFQQLTPEGKTVSLADYRGKYVLVDFWASWCGPCRQENPALIKLYNQYKGRNFDILGVSLDNEKGREKWLKAIQADGLPWTQISDLKGWQNEAARMYAVQSIPQNFLIDPKGKIVATNLRGDELGATLAKFLK